MTYEKTAKSGLFSIYRIFMLDNDEKSDIIVIVHLEGKSMDNLKIEYIPVTLLKPYQRNTRKHKKEDIAAIAKSIQEFGFDDPIGVLGQQNLIVEGHGRLEAAKKLNMDTVPCIRLDHLTDEQRRAYAIAHNRTAELSEWDEATRALEMLDISLDLSWLGMEQEESSANDGTPKPDLEQMELKAFEHYDYLVFVFRDARDWANACSYFNIHNVDGGYGETKKIGVGRVLEGARLLEAVGHPADSDQSITL